MSWRVWGEQLYTADFSGSLPVRSMPVVFDRDISLKAVRTWVVTYGSPVFTQLQLRLYSNQNAAPAQLIATFDKVWTLAEIQTGLSSALKEIYFDVAKPLSLKEGDTYHLALWATGYTGTENSHIGWVAAWPKPPNTGFTATIENLAIAPYAASFIGVEK
jgi:hypothetical protein